MGKVGKSHIARIGDRPALRQGFLIPSNFNFEYYLTRQKGRNVGVLILNEMIILISFAVVNYLGGPSVI